MIGFHESMGYQWALSFARDYDAGVWDGEFIDSPVFVSP